MVSHFFLHLLFAGRSVGSTGSPTPEIPLHFHYKSGDAEYLFSGISREDLPHGRISRAGGSPEREDLEREDLRRARICIYAMKIRLSKKPLNIKRFPRAFAHRGAAAREPPTPPPFCASRSTGASSVVHPSCPPDDMHHTFNINL